MICFRAITNPKLILGKNKAGYLTGILKGHMDHFRAETESLTSDKSIATPYIPQWSPNFQSISIHFLVTETIRPHWEVNLKIFVIHPLSALWINGSTGGEHMEKTAKIMECLVICRI